MIAQQKRDVIDPLQFKNVFWPDVQFYRQQVDIIYSVCNNIETYVPAGNQLGKDFVSAFIVLWFFMTRNPCKILTTTAKATHLDVLWGEMNRFIDSAKYPLRHEKGGPLIVHKDYTIRKIYKGTECPISRIMGMVASERSMEGLQGHHANPSDLDEANDGVPRTLVVWDEASALEDFFYDMVISWARRRLGITNTWHTTNFIRRAIDGGDIKAPDGDYFIRKVIRIKAEDSPNVRFAMAEKESGIEPTHRIVTPGVKTYRDYMIDRMMLDPQKQSVILDAEFYTGDTVQLVAPDWLKKAAALHDENVKNGIKNRAVACGCDPAEGGDNTSWSIVGRSGLIDLISVKTADTTKVVDQTIQIIRDHRLDPSNVIFDRGGGGHVHACALRRMGYAVRTVTFSDPAVPPPRHGIKTLAETIEQREERTIYKNRRVEMYDLLRQLLNPSGPHKFAIPENLLDKPRIDGGPSLRRQISVVPLLYDNEGKMFLPPKRRNPGTERGETMTEITGCSPDELDSFVIALFGLMKKPKAAVAEVV